MKEKEDSTARHIRCFGDLYLASSHLYACIDIYDLYRRVVNMISSLIYTYLYLIVLRSIILNDPQKKIICNNWRKIMKVDLNVPSRTVIDVLTNVLNVPKFSNLNNKILTLMILNNNHCKLECEEKENFYFNDNEDDHYTELNVPVLLLSNSNDNSNYVPPVEPEFGDSCFNIKKREFFINWNHQGKFDINALHLKYGKLITDDDLDIITDNFLWPKVKLTPTMSFIDKLSLILTGYLYTGELGDGTIERIFGDKKIDVKGIEMLPECIYQDLDLNLAQEELTHLKIKMSKKMKEFEQS